MEVILIKDLKRKGTFGDTIEVADGYARNFLIPKGFALIANKTNKKKFEEIKDKKMLEVSKLRDDLTKTADQIKGKTFTMTALSRDGKLYGSISPSIIVDQIKSELPDISINASDVIIEEGNIKFVGDYACKAQFTKNISASFTMVIESDETHEQPELLEAILDGDDDDTPVSLDKSNEDSDVDNDSEVAELDESGNDSDVEEASIVDEHAETEVAADSEESNHSDDSVDAEPSAPTDDSVDHDPASASES